MSEGGGSLMLADYKEITPQDAYLVTGAHLTFDFSVLLDLYQPIIGVEAVNLYLTLHNCAKATNITIKDARLHRHLVTASNLSFPALIKARHTLEAVGLLQTRCYKKVDDDKYLFEYGLLEPLSGTSFFSSDVLSLLLYNRIGEKSYLTIREKYADNYDWAKGEYLLQSDITRSFDEVFGHMTKGDLQSLTKSDNLSNFRPDQLKNSAIKLQENYLDIELIKGLVSNLHSVERSLDDKLIAKLNELAFLYQFTDFELATLLNDHYIYNGDGIIDEKLLRERALEKFQASGKKLTISSKEGARESDQKIVGAADSTDINLTKAERHLQVLENYSPIQLIQQYQGKGMIANADLKIIDSLLYEYQLLPAVTNVLLEYIMLTNEYKLPRNLIEKIAGHWKRLKLTTAAQAMDAAKKEHQIYLDWSTDKTPKSSGTANKRAQRGKGGQLPDYIVQQDERYHKGSDKTAEEPLDPERLAEIERLLKGLS